MRESSVARQRTAAMTCQHLADAASAEAEETSSAGRPRRISAYIRRGQRYDRHFPLTIRVSFNLI